MTRHLLEVKARNRNDKFASVRMVYDNVIG